MIELNCHAYPALQVIGMIEQYAFDHDWNFAECELHAPIQFIHNVRETGIHYRDPSVRQEFIDGKNVVSVILPSGTFKLTPTKGTDLLVKRNGDAILVARLA